MNMNGIGPLDYRGSGYGTGRTRRNTADAAGSAEGSFARQMGNTGTTQKKVYKVYMKTDDMLYSGGNGSGLSFYLKYAEDSTEEDPVVVAKGVDENGNEFEQTIHINDINPRNATIVQMRALEAYLGVEKNAGFSSLPFSVPGNMGLHDRGNFITMFQDSIRDMNTLGQRKSEAYYRYSMQAYLNFMADRKEKDSSYGTAAGNLLQNLLQNPLTGGNPLQQRLQQTAPAQENEEEEVLKAQEKKKTQESESDTEIITQADGSKILMITNRIGGMKTVTSIRLSNPSPLQNDYVKTDIEGKEAAALENKEDKKEHAADAKKNGASAGGVENEH